MYHLPKAFLKGTTNNPLNIMAYPNPTQNELNISYTSLADGQLNITLTDLSGKQVLTQPLECTKGNNSLNIDVKQVPNGIYLLNVTNGTQNSVLKITIQK